MMIELVKHVILIGVLVYVGLGVFLYITQRSQMYLPLLGARSCEELLAVGAKRVTQDATTLYYHESGPTLVVFYHGNGGSACDRVFLAEEFAARGVSFLFVEYAGYADARPTTKEAMFEDVRNAHDFANSLSVERVVLMGESLGVGPVAFHTTLQTPDGVVLVAPYTRISDTVAAHFPYSLYPTRWLVKDNFDTSALAAFHGETLVVHAVNDEITPFRLGMTVFESIPSEKKEFMAVRGAGHNDVLWRPDVLEKVGNFVREGV